MTLVENTIAGHRRAPSRARGFTLLELMITISVAGVLLTVGVPSFVDLVRNNRAATNVNELLTALSIARSESIKRGWNVSVCRSSDGATCTGAWSDGWIAFRDDAATDTAVPVVGEVLRIWPAMPGNAAVTTFANGARPPAEDGFPAVRP
jgi:type IV fimbrial biogenesis protein FimT